MLMKTHAMAYQECKRSVDDLMTGLMPVCLCAGLLSAGVCLV